MFAEHQPLVAKHAQASDAGFYSLGLFVLATVRVPLARAARDCAAIVAGDTTPDRCPGTFFGYKLRAAAEWRDTAPGLRAEMLAAWREGAGAAELTLRASAVRGLGLAKGGFLVQLAFGASGCLDTHNLARWGLDARRFRVDGASARTREQRVRDYCETVDRCGGTAVLWDAWCDYVAAQNPGLYECGDHVSALHPRALGIPAEWSRGG